jgi:hypothetical protein
MAVIYIMPKYMFIYRKGIIVERTNKRIKDRRMAMKMTVPAWQPSRLVP